MNEKSNFVISKKYSKKKYNLMKFKIDCFAKPFFKFLLFVTKLFEHFFQNQYSTYSCNINTFFKSLFLFVFIPFFQKNR
jgi:hypothetical protein